MIFLFGSARPRAKKKKGGENFCCPHFPSIFSPSPSPDHLAHFQTGHAPGREETSTASLKRCINLAKQHEGADCEGREGKLESFFSSERANDAKRRRRADEKRSWPFPCCSAPVPPRKASPPPALSMTILSPFVVEKERERAEKERKRFECEAAVAMKAAMTTTRPSSSLNDDGSHHLHFPSSSTSSSTKPSRWPPHAGSGTRNTPCRSAPRERAASPSLERKASWKREKRATPFLSFFRPFSPSSGRFFRFFPLSAFRFCFPALLRTLQRFSKRTF